MSDAPHSMPQEEAQAQFHKTREALIGAVERAKHVNLNRQQKRKASIPVDAFEYNTPPGVAKQARRMLKRGAKYVNFGNWVAGD